MMVNVEWKVEQTVHSLLSEDEARILVYYAKGMRGRKPTVDEEIQQRFNEILDTYFVESGYISGATLQELADQLGIDDGKEYPDIEFVD